MALNLTCPFPHCYDVDLVKRNQNLETALVIAKNALKSYSDESYWVTVQEQHVGRLTHTGETAEKALTEIEELEKT
jgi:hypothetical protein